RPAIRLPENPRLRTTRPNVWPLVSTIRWPAMNGVVATIICVPSIVLMAGARRVPGRSFDGLARAAGRVLRARTSVPEEGERVEPGGVAVAPVRRDGVVPHEVDVGHAGLLVG